MKFVALVFSALLLSSCTHTISFRTAHFATPITGEQQWNGHVAGVVSSVTKVTVVNDITTVPPARTSLDVNKDYDAGDLLFLNDLGVDLSLTVLQSLDLFMESSVYGVRWQFLNHGSKSDVWVGSIQAAYGERNYSSDKDNSGVASKADSKIKTTQGGISIGYKFNAVAPYVSYIHESHDVATEVVNGGGHFGPYSDKGTHQNFSVGLTSHRRGSVYAIEYNMINITWDRADTVYQKAIGLKLGFAW